MKTRFAIILFAASATLAQASPSGLNNIPTADTPGHRESVIQWYSTFDDSDGEDHVAGFLYLLHKNWALESWVSQPTENGPTSVTLKLDFIFRF